MYIIISINNNIWHLLQFYCIFDAFSRIWGLLTLKTSVMVSVMCVVVVVVVVARLVSVMCVVVVVVARLVSLMSGVGSCSAWAHNENVTTSASINTSQYNNKPGQQETSQVYTDYSSRILLFLHDVRSSCRGDRRGLHWAEERILRQIFNSVRLCRPWLIKGLYGFPINNSTYYNLPAIIWCFLQSSFSSS